MAQKPLKTWPGTAEIMFLRVQLATRAAQASSAHIYRAGRAGTCRTITSGHACNCGHPARLRAGIQAERDLLDELEDMLGGDPYQEGRAALEILAKLVAAYPDWRDPAAGGPR